MKRTNNIEGLLLAAAPKPKRELSPGFTDKVIHRLEAPTPPRSIFSRIRFMFQFRLAPLTLGFALAISALTAGTVYAALNGWNVTTFFSGETNEPSGSRIVKVETTNCTTRYTPLAFQHLYHQQHGATYYFRINSDSSLTNGEITRMVQGYCELGQQILFDQKIVIPEIMNIPANKNAQIFGLFASSTVKHIDENFIDVEADIPVGRDSITQIKKLRYTFKAIDPSVVVYDIDRKISLQDIRVGDNVAIKYRIPKTSSEAQEVSPDSITTHDKTVVSITKNPSNISAALEYEKYYKDLKEVTPCSKNASGYCSAEEYAN